MLRNWLVSKERALRSRLERAEGEEGFTLIEMSIVLVIIGLLIGGVLKGQELIASTRLKTTVSQWDAAKASINGFIDKFSNLPGDYNLATTYLSVNGVNNGDGDGTIGTAVVTGNWNSANVGADGTENLNAWAHMAAAGLIAGVTIKSGAVGAQSAASGGVLMGKISGTSWAVVHGVAQTTSSVWARLQGGTGAPTPSLSAKQAAEIDRKYDDGVSTSGSIVSDDNETCTTSSNGVYNALQTTNACVMAFNLQ